MSASFIACHPLRKTAIRLFIFGHLLGKKKHVLFRCCEGVSNLAQDIEVTQNLDQRYKQILSLDQRRWSSRRKTHTLSFWLVVLIGGIHSRGRLPSPRGAGGNLTRVTGPPRRESGRRVGTQALGTRTKRRWCESIHMADAGRTTANLWEKLIIYLIVYWSWKWCLLITNVVKNAYSSDETYKLLHRMKRFCIKFWNWVLAHADLGRYFVAKPFRY